MTEYAFVKSCIKVAGFVVLLLGLIGLILNMLLATLNLFQAKMAVSGGFDASTYAFAKTTMNMAAKSVVMRVPGNIVQILVGLYLCRRYQRPLNWLMKD